MKIVQSQAEQKRTENKELKAAREEAAQLRETLALVQRENQRYNIEAPGEDNSITLGVISDLHYGSRYTERNTVKALFDTLKQAKVETVLIPGDILDGHNVYRGQVFEQTGRGIDEQIAFGKQFAKICPCPVKFITGNHDESFKKAVGTEIGTMIADAYGWEYLGSESATLDIRTRNKRKYTVQLLHPGGGCAYAISYRLQKIVEQLEGGRKPHMLINGHYHKAELLPAYRNVTGVQAGCAQWQTPFMLTRGLAAHVGVWVIRITVSSTSLLFNRVQAEFVPVYRAKS